MRNSKLKTAGDKSDWEKVVDPCAYAWEQPTEQSMIKQQQRVCVVVWSLHYLNWLQVLMVFKEVLSIMSRLAILSNTTTDYNECVCACNFVPLQLLYAVLHISLLRQTANEMKIIQKKNTHTRTNTKTMGERSSKIIANSGMPNGVGVDFSTIRVESQI